MEAGIYDFTYLMRDAEKREEGREKGREEGRTEGETKFATLTARLLEAKRYEELEKATKDMEFRRQLYQEFHIED